MDRIITGPTKAFQILVRHLKLKPGDFRDVDGNAERSRTELRSSSKWEREARRLPSRSRKRVESFFCKNSWLQHLFSWLFIAAYP